MVGAPGVVVRHLCSGERFALLVGQGIPDAVQIIAGGDVHRIADNAAEVFAGIDSDHRTGIIAAGNTAGGFHIPGNAANDIIASHAAGIVAVGNGAVIVACNTAGPFAVTGDYGITAAAGDRAAPLVGAGNAACTIHADKNAVAGMAVGDGTLEILTADHADEAVAAKKNGIGHGQVENAASVYAAEETHVHHGSLKIQAADGVVAAVKGARIGICSAADGHPGDQIVQHSAACVMRLCVDGDIRRQSGAGVVIPLIDRIGKPIQLCRCADQVGVIGRAVTCSRLDSRDGRCICSHDHACAQHQHQQDCQQLLHHVSSSPFFSCGGASALTGVWFWLWKSIPPSFIVHKKVAKPLPLYLALCISARVIHSGSRRGSIARWCWLPDSCPDRPCRRRSR